MIGIAAPASCFDRAPFEAAVSFLREAGYGVTYQSNIFDRKDYLAGTVQRRVEELHNLFKRDDIDAILCARGGYGSVSLLDHLDFSEIAKHPKIFVGYSDLTPLLGALRERSALVCFHGPVLTGLVAKNDEESRERMLEILAGQTMRPLSGGRCINPGQAVGELTGGNLALLAATVGTPYQVETRGRIVLIEDVGERPYRLDRMLLQLRMSGFFDGAAGIAAGDFVGCGKPGYDRPVEDILKERLGDLPIPIGYNLPFGHGVTTGTLPLGVQAHLDVTEGVLSMIGDAVRQPTPHSVGV